MNIILHSINICYYTAIIVYICVTGRVIFLIVENLQLFQLSGKMLKKGRMLTLIVCQNHVSDRPSHLFRYFLSRRILLSRSSHSPFTS